MLCKAVIALALALAPLSLAQISDDFESGWDQTKWPIYAPDCNQGGTVTLDSTTAHSGKNSLKVVSPGGYCGHIFFGTTSVPANNVWVRVWLKAQNALTSNHVSFLTMPDSGLGTGKHLRMGGQDAIMMYNRESDDATLPDLSPQGVATSIALPTGSFQCLEYYLGSDGTIQTFLNGNAIAGLTVGPGITNANANGWGSAYKPNIQGVYFGWESYGGDVNTFWYDDVSIGTSRAGCGTGTGTTTTTSSRTTTTTTTSSRTTTSSTTTSPTTSSRTTTTSSGMTTSRTTTTTSRSTTTTSPTTTSRTTTTTTTTTAAGGTQTQWGQCGGIGWTGPTACVSPYTCKVSNPYYSQCLA